MFLLAVHTDLGALLAVKGILILDEINHVFNDPGTCSIHSSNYALTYRKQLGKHLTLLFRTCKSCL